MPSLAEAEIGLILRPFLGETQEQQERELREHPGLLSQLSSYLNLLVQWNSRTNLTSIRDPRAMVPRHFGESLFLARHLQSEGSVLDLGSGAGFPGIPIQLWHPSLKVTLAESQGKKASFLREAVRRLSLATEVWAERVELLEEVRQFDAVVMRAVDNPERAMAEAERLSRRAVWLMGTEPLPFRTVRVGWIERRRIAVPVRENAILVEFARDVFHVEHVG